MTLLALFLYFNVFFFISYRKNNLALVDVAWGPSFLVISLGTFLESSYKDIRSWVILSFVSIWAIRLAYFIFKRSKIFTKEDARYTLLRSRWKDNIWPKAYLKVFILQGVLAYFIALPLVFYFKSDFVSPFGNLIDFLGIFLFLVGFIIEIIADEQKLHFKKNNFDQVCNVGLWSRSRHPNYFGEMTLWLGLLILCLNKAPLFTTFSYLFLVYVLVEVTGKRLMEKRHKDDSEYQKYMEKTNSFFPI